MANTVDTGHKILYATAVEVDGITRTLDSMKQEAKDEKLQKSLEEIMVFLT